MIIIVNRYCEDKIMAKKELKIEDVITKIKAGFRKDIYLIDNRYCIAGETTSEDLITSVVLVFNPEVSELLNSLFPETKYVHIVDVANAKNSLLDHVVKLTTYNKTYCDGVLNNVLHKYDSINTWKNFIFTDSEIDDFKEGKDIDLEEKDTLLTNLSFGKNVLPFITPAKLNDVTYNIQKAESELIELCTSYVLDYFQVYNMISFLNY